MTNCQGVYIVPAIKMDRLTSPMDPPDLLDIREVTRSKECYLRFRTLQGHLNQLKKSMTLSKEIEVWLGHGALHFSYSTVEPFQFYFQRLLQKLADESGDIFSYV
jgi:hypothetical protein